MKRRVWTDGERQQRRETAIRLELARYAVPGGGRRLWSAEDTALLGVLSDAEVTRRAGRTVDAVRIKRQKLAIANPVDGRTRQGPAMLVTQLSL